MNPGPPDRIMRGLAPGHRTGLLGSWGILPPLLITALAAAAHASPGDWPMARHDPRQTAFTRLSTPRPATVSGWRFQASSHVWGYQPGMNVWSSPAVGLVKGRVVLLAGSYDRNLYALDGRSGERLWRFTSGGGIYSAPALWRGPSGQALAFAASSDRSVYALDADLGRRLWVHTVEAWRPTMGGARLSAPAVGLAGGRAALFVGHWVWDKSLSGHQQAGGLTALDALTGRKLWTAPLGDNRVASPIFARVAGAGRVFVGSDNGNLYALDADSGAEVWRFTDRQGVEGSPALFEAGGASFLVFGSRYGRVRCLHAGTGKELWRFAATHWVDSSPLVAPVGGRETVLVGSYDTHLYALDALTGIPRWSHRTAGGVYSSPALASHGGRLLALVSSWDHHLHCVDTADGALAWSAFTGRPLWDSLPLGESTWSSPVVAEIDGQAVAYLGSYSGPLLAIPLSEAERRALARPGSNLDFWLSLPLVMGGVAAMALTLTWWRRRRQPRPPEAGGAGT